MIVFFLVYQDQENLSMPKSQSPGGEQMSYN